MQLDPFYGEQRRQLVLQWLKQRGYQKLCAL